jgi:hypothetical protein
VEGPCLTLGEGPQDKGSSMTTSPSTKAGRRLWRIGLMATLAVVGFFSLVFIGEGLLVAYEHFFAWVG